MIHVPNRKPDSYALPNALREAMLNADVPKSLVLLEGLYMLNFKSGTWLTFEEIYRVCRDNFGMSRRLVYEGLQVWRIFQRRKSEGKANQRGARAYLYRIPHPDELIAEFAPTLRYSPHDRLKKSDLKSVKAYRLALHRMMFRRKWLDNNGGGFVMSRKLMADRLNVSVRTVRVYDKELGHSNTPNYKEVPITQENWYKLPRYKDKFDANGKRLPSKIWLKTVEDGKWRNLPYVRYLAYKALNAGQYTVAVERLPNTYYPYQVQDPRDYDNDVISHYLAECHAKEVAGFYQDRNQWVYRGD